MAFLMCSSVAALIWLAPAIPVRINWTTSAPLGLYSTSHGSDLARGDLVAVCLPDAIAALGLARGYLSAGTCANGTSPVLKRVVAAAGDEVELRRDLLAINGRIIDCSPRPSNDSLGRPLEPPPFGRRVVAAGEVWLLGIHRDRSWDSRNFGPVAVSSIVGIVRPLLATAARKPE